MPKINNDCKNDIVAYIKKYSKQTIVEVRKNLLKHKNEIELEISENKKKVMQQISNIKQKQLLLLNDLDKLEHDINEKTRALGVLIVNQFKNCDNSKCHNELENDNDHNNDNDHDNDHKECEHC